MPMILPGFAAIQTLHDDFKVAPTSDVFQNQRTRRPAIDLLVATLGGPTNRHVERVFDPSRKEKHWGRHKLARDR
jgi:hypothetical protein